MNNFKFDLTIYETDWLLNNILQENHKNLLMMNLDALVLDNSKKLTGDKCNKYLEFINTQINYFDSFAQKFHSNCQEVYDKHQYDENWHEYPVAFEFELSEPDTLLMTSMFQLYLQKVDYMIERHKLEKKDYQIDWIKYYEARFDIDLGIFIKIIQGMNNA